MLAFKQKGIYNMWHNLKSNHKLGAVAHACNSQHFGRLRQVDRLRSGVQDQPGQYGETSPLLKIQKLAVVPATPDAQEGKLLEPRRQKLQ